MTLGAPQGPLDAPLCLVGRDWGFEEHAAQRSFVGASGRTLDRALAHAGIERGRCLVTNVVNARPVGNKWEAHSRETVAAGVAELVRVLSGAPRRLIVALGAEAFQACRGVDPNTRPEVEFDGNGITELRGYVFEGPWGPVLASTHPAFILRTWLPWWPCFLWDLAKAKRWLAGKERVAAREEIIVRNPQGRVDWSTYSLPLALDIETAGAHAQTIRCVGVAQESAIGYVYPFNEETRDELAQILASPAPKIFHNGQFDVTILERQGFTVNNWQHDTMLLWATLEPLIAGKSKEKGQATQKSLRFLASLLTDEPWWKLYNYSTEDDQLRLCAQDARLTWECWQALWGRLKCA